MTPHRANSTFAPDRAGPGRFSPLSPRVGTVLLEVVFAMALFMLGCGVVFSGLNASFAGAEKVRLAGQAADLAVTKLSQLQLGAIDMADDGPNAYEEEDLAAWTWEIVVGSLESSLTDESDLQQVEIVVRNTERNTVHRLACLMAEVDSDAGEFGGGL
jgi:hypothetical protein